MGLPGRPSRRQDIVDEAERMVRNGEIDRLSTRTLFSRIGIGRGTLYGHFPSPAIERLLLSLSPDVQQLLPPGVRERALRKVETHDGRSPLRQRVHALTVANPGVAADRLDELEDLLRTPELLPYDRIALLQTKAAALGGSVDYFVGRSSFWTTHKDGLARGVLCLEEATKIAFVERDYGRTVELRRQITSALELGYGHSFETGTEPVESPFPSDREYFEPTPSPPPRTLLDVARDELRAHHRTGVSTTANRIAATRSLGGAMGLRLLDETSSDWNPRLQTDTETTQELDTLVLELAELVDACLSHANLDAAIEAQHALAELQALYADAAGLGRSTGLTTAGRLSPLDPLQTLVSGNTSNIVGGEPPVAAIVCARHRAGDLLSAIESAASLPTPKRYAAWLNAELAALHAKLGNDDEADVCTARAVMEYRKPGVAFLPRDIRARIWSLITIPEMFGGRDPDTELPAYRVQEVHQQFAAAVKAIEADGRPIHERAWMHLQQALRETEKATHAALAREGRGPGF